MSSIKTKIIRSGSFDPWTNLALEEALLDSVQKDEIILYLWQNSNTVVIGRNQNPWKECDHARLESDGGKLARRLSGGGAVFHDLGNLNFTFIADREIFDIQRQLSVILDCVRKNGIDAEFSGRNDITVSGRKFSGNAFCYRENSAYHHGTLLVDSDFEKLSRYLTVSKDKIVSKGVSSVKSRVVNLKSINASIDICSLSESMMQSFESEYGTLNCTLVPSDFDIKELSAKYSSWNWRYGQSPKFDISLEKRFGWGGVEICLMLKNGKVAESKVFSDSLNTCIIEKIERNFIGCRFNPSDLVNAVNSSSAKDDEAPIAGDIASLIENSSLF